MAGCCLSPQRWFEIQSLVDWGHVLAQQYICNWRIFHKNSIFKRFPTHWEYVPYYFTIYVFFLVARGILKYRMFWRWGVLYLECFVVGMFWGLGCFAFGTFCTSRDVWGLDRLVTGKFCLCDILWLGPYVLGRFVFGTFRDWTFSLRTFCRCPCWWVLTQVATNYM
jgi:hypothetical protein